MQAKIDNLKMQLSDLKRQLRSMKTSKSNGRMALARAKKKTDSPPAFAAKLKLNLTGHYGKVMAIDCFRSAERIVSASQDGKLMVWSGYTGNKLECLTMPSIWVVTCAIEQENGHFVASGGLDNCCTVYALGHPSSADVSFKLSGHTGYLSSCNFVTPGSILTSSGDKSCCLYDIESMKLLSRFVGHSADVLSTSMAPNDRNCFLTGSCDATIKLWDIRVGKATHTFFGHDSDVNSVKFFPDGIAFGSGSDDASCRLFDIRCYGEINVMSNQKTSSGVTSGIVYVFAVIIQNVLRL